MHQCAWVDFYVQQNQQRVLYHTLNFSESLSTMVTQHCVHIKYVNSIVWWAQCSFKQSLSAVHKGLKVEPSSPESESSRLPIQKICFSINPLKGFGCTMYLDHLYRLPKFPTFNSKVYLELSRKKPQNYCRPVFLLCLDRVHCVRSFSLYFSSKDKR